VYVDRTDEYPDGVRSSRVVQAIQGKTNDGNWLPRLAVSANGEQNFSVLPHELGDMGSTDEVQEGFTTLSGRGSGWFATFLGIPHDTPGPLWEAEGAELGLQKARVTGYQMRVTACYVDTARFLFRSFAPGATATLLCVYQGLLTCGCLACACQYGAVHALHFSGL
jgi:hypothetical protein